jgi:hypothetical protein
MSKIILEQHHLIKSLHVLKQWKYKRKDLIVNPKFYFILFSYVQLRFYLLLLTKPKFALFVSFPYED